MNPSNRLRGLVIGTAVTFALIPLLWTLLASLGVVADSSTTPPVWQLPPTLDFYGEIRTEQTFFWDEFAVSFALSAAISAVTLGAAAPAAYALSRWQSRWRSTALYVCLTLASLPAVAVVLPLAEILRTMRLTDTFGGVLLAESALFAPLAVYLLVGYLDQVPADVEEAALIDGAPPLQRLVWILLPALIPGLVAVGTLVFALSWNQFILPAVLTQTHIRTLPVQMRDFFALEREFDWRIAAAVIVLSLLPVGAAAALAYRSLERLKFNP
ncbi:MAG: carbohydrate ABC transporter permease [Chloroflexota bacterium]|nr:carbohydrate ABC transporter permease [Chloroflexota bacterium]